ncbi:MAG: 5'-nucleotidase [Raineya sp.]|nr:5'-nucleotidase [Raineya sp.]
MKKFLFIVGFAIIACKPTFYQITQRNTTFTEVNASLKEDAQVLQTIEPYKKQLEAQMQRIIGYAEIEIANGRKINETPLGNLVADMCQQRASREIGKNVDLGFVTFGGLRTSIPAGAIKVSDIFELMPFENELVVLEIDGKTMRKLFEYLVVTRNIAISNSKVLIKGGQLKDVLVNNEPIEENRIYRVATSDYLASGGDNMTFLKEAKNIIFTNVKYRDMIIQAIEDTHKQGKKITSSVGGRVEERP